MVGSITDGRTYSTKDITSVECAMLIDRLDNRLSGSLRKMRAKAINIAKDIGLIASTGTEKIDWGPLNKWTNGKWGKAFWALDYDELRNCVTALENWRDQDIIKMVNELLNPQQ